MQQSKSYRVLVVEDEGLIAHDIARRLETLGHTVAGTVATADEAIALAPQADLVLMDIRIDGNRDGVDAATEIRGRCSVPVIFLTAHADRSTLERAKIAGPSGYIVKPLGPATLQSSIEIAIYKHSVERQLEEREAWLRTTVASAGEGIIAADTGGRVLLVNAAAEALTGWTEAGAQGQPITSVLILTDGIRGAKIRDLEALAILKDAPVRLKRGVHVHSRSGGATQVDGAVSPVKVASGIIGVVVTLHDVTAKQWEDYHLRQSERSEALTRLANGVATEYSSIVGTIRKEVVHLTQQFGEYAPARRTLELIEEAVANAERITQHLASLGDRLPAEPQLTSLNSIVRRMAPAIESAVHGRLATDIQPRVGAGRILADPVQVEQAIMSVLIHALAVTRSGGTLSIQTSRVNAGAGDSAGLGFGSSFAALTVTYSAIEPDVERLFNPSNTGNGFTLAVAQSIVTEQGGVLTAGALESGTEIQMLLPVVEESVSNGLGAEAIRTILLVEARALVRTHLHNVAESAGYNLLEATDAAEAIGLCELQDAPVDLLIASPEDALRTTSGLSKAHAPRMVLRIVGRTEQGVDELQQPFTQKAFLDRIGALAKVMAEPGDAQAAAN